MAGAGTTSPFTFRGVIEGFYGVYYTAAERDDMIRFIGRHGYNFFIYAPKNDRQHRMRWREPYPDYIMDEFAHSVKVAEESGVTFCYSIGAGVSMCYASEEDFAAITQKFRAFYERGVQAFSITLDDISAEFKHEADRARYKTFAEAHADVCNRLLGWLKQLDPACTLNLCPTDYHGVAPFSDYTHELGRLLDPEVALFYTGPEICSTDIPAAQAAAFAEAVRRKPIIWDNYPVNDLDMKPELHLGPIQGRGPELVGVVQGFLVNTMMQAEASKIALLTFADYMRDPAGYEPWSSWENALRALAGDGYPELRLFAEHSLKSCLKQAESVELGRLTDAAMAVLQAGGGVEHPDVQALETFVTSLDEACYFLKNRLRNTALRNNLLPWIEVLEPYHWMTKRALLVIDGIRKGEPRESWQGPLNMFKESRDEIAKHPKRMGGEPLMAVADYALSLVESQQ